MSDPATAPTATLAERWHRFWFENQVLRSRLTMFRVAVFGMLAFDMWLLMFVHAPRYGAGGFNVSHLPFLDSWLPTPTPAMAGVLYLVGGFLALRVALGERADRLAVVHLDHESRPDRRDRVVARFADDRDGAVLLAAAEAERGPNDPQPQQANAAVEPPPAARAGRRNRIPRYQ